MPLWSQRFSAPEQAQDRDAPASLLKEVYRRQGQIGADTAQALRDTVFTINNYDEDDFDEYPGSYMAGFAAERTFWAAHMGAYEGHLGTAVLAVHDSAIAALNAGWVDTLEEFYALWWKECRCRLAIDQPEAQELTTKGVEDYEDLKRYLESPERETYIPELMTRRECDPKEDPEWPTPTNREDVEALVEKLSKQAQTYCALLAAELVLPLIESADIYERAYAGLRLALSGEGALDEISGVEEAIWSLARENPGDTPEYAAISTVSWALWAAALSSLLPDAIAHTVKWGSTAAERAGWMPREEFFALWWKECRCRLALDKPETQELTTSGESREFCTLTEEDYDDATDSYPGWPNGPVYPVPCRPGPDGPGTAWKRHHGYPNSSSEPETIGNPPYQELEALKKYLEAPGRKPPKSSLFLGRECDLPEDPDWPAPKNEQEVGALLNRLPEIARAMCALIAAELVLPIWEAEYPEDDRPQAAIRAAHDWLNSNISRDAVIEAINSAQNSYWAALGLGGAAATAADAIVWGAMAIFWGGRSNFDVNASAAVWAAIAMELAHWMSQEEFYNLWWRECRCRLATSTPTEAIPTTGALPIRDYVKEHALTARELLDLVKHAPPYMYKTTDVAGAWSYLPGEDIYGYLTTGEYYNLHPVVNIEEINVDAEAIEIILDTDPIYSDNLEFIVYKKHASGYADKLASLYGYTCLVSKGSARKVKEASFSLDGLISVLQRATSTDPNMPIVAMFRGEADPRAVVGVCWVDEDDTVLLRYSDTFKEKR